MVPEHAALTPSWAEDLLRQADAFRRAGRYPLALEIYRRAAAGAPGSAVAQQHLGALLSVLGRPDEAEAALRRALALRPADPTVRHALALALMAQGRYAEAWPFYEARHEIPQLRLPKPQGLSFPEWRGEPLAGKRLVLLPEQGYGDQIQYARFVPALLAQGAAVRLLTLPPLARLFAHSFPGAEVIPAEGAIRVPDADAWCLTGALPGRMGATLERLPSAPYLSAPAAGPPLGRGFRIGLVTRGSPDHANDARRSLGAEDARRLRAGLPGRVIDLDPAATGAADFADTAAIVAQLDLVVSVDTAVAHLAGAMGRPAFVLVPGLGADWRWMQARTDSPWHPSLTLYRGDLQGWGSAIERLLHDAGALAGAG